MYRNTTLKRVWGPVGSRDADALTAYGADVVYPTVHCLVARGGYDGENGARFRDLVRQLGTSSLHALADLLEEGTDTAYESMIDKKFSQPVVLNHDAGVRLHAVEGANMVSDFAPPSFGSHDILKFACQRALQAQAEWGSLVVGRRLSDEIQALSSRL